MFFSEFGSILDIYTWHFISAVGVSFVTIIVTLILSKKMLKDDNSKSVNEESKAKGMETPLISANASEEATNMAEGEPKRGLKSSPAVLAEQVIKANMTEEQKTLEQQIRRKQLSEIFKLMQKESDKFGDISITELEDQMRMYQ